MKKKLPPKEVRAKNGNFIGMLKGGVLLKKVVGSKHKYRAIGDNGSWGIDFDALHNLPVGTTIRVEDSETRTIYQAPVKLYKEHGVILHFKEGTDDHNVQCFLPLEYFMKIQL